MIYFVEIPLWKVIDRKLEYLSLYIFVVVHLIFENTELLYIGRKKEVKLSEFENIIILICDLHMKIIYLLNGYMAVAKLIAVNT